MSPCNDNAWGEPSPVPRFTARHVTPEMEREATKRARETARQHAASLDWIAKHSPPEQLVHIGWYCWRCRAINAQACRSDCVPIHVPAEWEREMRAEIARREEEPDDVDVDTAVENMQVRTLTPEIMEEFHQYRNKHQSHHRGDTT